MNARPSGGGRPPEQMPTEEQMLRRLAAVDAYEADDWQGARALGLLLVLSAAVVLMFVGLWLGATTPTDTASLRGVAGLGLFLTGLGGAARALWVARRADR